MDWIRKAYDSAGLTQYPVGTHLGALQARFGGAVVLCIDVSGSMSGSPLGQAIVGSKLFVAEALQNHYDAGVLLWDTGIQAAVAPTSDRSVLDAALQAARAGGGTNVLPALLRAEQLLEGRSGDRVIAIFGDGDLGDASGALREATRLAGLGIRVITCGLGDASAEQLGAISTETADGPRVAQSGGIAEAIAGMASGLRQKR